MRRQYGTASRELKRDAHVCLRLVVYSSKARADVRKRGRVRH
jgi:hypothetical protein